MTSPVEVETLSIARRTAPDRLTYLGNADPAESADVEALARRYAPTGAGVSVRSNRPKPAIGSVWPSRRSVFQMLA